MVHSFIKKQNKLLTSNILHHYLIPARCSLLQHISTLHITCLACSGDIKKLIHLQSRNTSTHEKYRLKAVHTSLMQ
jgi:hypothetical protein